MPKSEAAIVKDNSDSGCAASAASNDGKCLKTVELDFIAVTNCVEHVEF